MIWRGNILLSFRDIPDPQQTLDLNSSSFSVIGLVFLNSDFTPASDVFLINTFSRAEDARLLNIDEHLYIIFSDNRNEVVTEGGFRMYVGELDYDGTRFDFKSLEVLNTFPGQSNTRREKNWVPFDYNDRLMLSYSIQPHRVFYPLLDGSEECLEWSRSESSNLCWKWGELRGGTPALKCGSEYLAFFHSSIDIATEHSNDICMSHYFIGAYTFEKDPPFSLTKISPHPIVGEHFYSGKTYPYYWKPVQVVFPGGYVLNDTHIFLAFGRHDHEIWISKIDKQKLFESLISLE